MKTVLIVEDEFMNYLYLTELFEGTDTELLYASNGREAVDICTNNKSVDLVLMDIRMPVMNGFIATKLIREIRPDLPIISQTAYAIESDTQGLFNDFDDCLIKPISRNDFVKKLERFL